LGEKDELISASSAHSLQHEKHIKIHVISGMGHFPFGSFAEEVINFIKNYLFSLNKSVSNS
jgi:pimeloyl-ACP methyl ester carboxylesterase